MASVALLPSSRCASSAKSILDENTQIPVIDLSKPITPSRLPQWDHRQEDWRALSHEHRLGFSQSDRSDFSRRRIQLELAHPSPGSPVMLTIFSSHPASAAP